MPARRTWQPPPVARIVTCFSLFSSIMKQRSAQQKHMVDTGRFAHLLRISVSSAACLILLSIEVMQLAIKCAMKSCRSEFCFLIRTSLRYSTNTNTQTTTTKAKLSNKSPRYLASYATHSLPTQPSSNSTTTYKHNGFLPSHFLPAL